MDLKITVHDISTVEKKIDVTVPADSVTSKLDEFYKTLRSTVRIKGFRPGKAPRSILERFYGKQAENEVLTKLVDDTLQETFQEKEIHPVSQPIIDNDKLKAGEDFMYTVRVEVAPQIPLDEPYRGLEVQQEKVAVTDDDVDNYLKQLRDYHSQLKALDPPRPICSGDFIVIDYAGSLEGVPLKGGEVKDKLLEVQPDSFLPGFTSQLIGLRQGDEREITVTLPDDYAEKELAGKALVFRVAIKDIKEKITPPLDDHFARDMGEFETLSDLRAHLRKEIEAREEQRVLSLLHDAIVQKIVENNPFDAPPSLVEKQTDFLIFQARSRLREQGITLDSSAMVDRELKQAYRPVAELQVKRTFLLKAIAAKEGVTVSPAEIKEYLDKLASASGHDLKNLTEGPEREEARERVKEKVLEDKTLAFLEKESKIETIERKPTP